MPFLSHSVDGPLATRLKTNRDVLKVYDWGDVLNALS